MQRKTHKFVIVFWAVNAACLLALATAGCARKDQTQTLSKAEEEKPKEPAGKGSEQKQQAATPDKAYKETALDLLQEQMQIYHDMATVYEKATTQVKLQETLGTIKLLQEKRVKLQENFNAYPAAEKQAATAQVKSDWDETMKRLKKAKSMKRE
jgi:hypothetical protein